MSWQEVKRQIQIVEDVRKEEVVGTLLRRLEIINMDLTNSLCHWHLIS